jgi:RHS repeat-associated protein
MRARVLLSTMLVVLCWAAPSMAAVPPGLKAYRVQMVLYPGDDAAAVAKRLAAMYRGTLETPVDAAGGFTIALSPAGAHLMGRDPAVKQLEIVEADRIAETTAVATPWKLGNYEYDGSGNIRKIGADFYVYDTRSRLVVSADATASPVVHKQTYAYDNLGNQTAINTAGVGQTTLTVNTSSNRVTTVNSGVAAVNPVYDPAGNLTQYGTATYTYDALNVLTRSTIDGVTRYYVYTANDERVGTVELSASGTRSDWTIRDAGGQVLRRLSKESNGEWKWQEDYIYRGSQMLAAEVPDSTKTRHFHLDHLGTPRLITGNGGVELSRHNYHPFGVEIAPTSTANITATQEKKQFTGHERDAESLDYMHARFYAPYMGRFLAVDPYLDVKRATQSPQGWNRYSYVVNNPMNGIDPDGRADVGLDCVPASVCTAEVRAAVREGQTQVLEIGLAAGAAYVIGRFSPSAARALFSWALGNPNQATQVASAVLSPPGCSAMPNPEAIGAAIGGRVAGQATGKLSTIANEISGLGMSQGTAATAVNSAVQAMGLRTTGIVSVGGNLVVGSVQVGANKPVMVIDAQGVVRQATATIEVAKKTMDIIIKDLKY